MCRNKLSLAGAGTSYKALRGVEETRASAESGEFKIDTVVKAEELAVQHDAKVRLGHGLHAGGKNAAFAVPRKIG